MNLCRAIAKHLIGRRELWLSCDLPPRHNGAHRDNRRKGHFWEETFYFGEFEHGRAKMPTVRKVRLCKKCGKEKRTDGANDACVCQVIGATKSQSILFADEREAIERQAALNELADDIAWLMEQWKREADEDGYHGVF